MINQRTYTIEEVRKMRDVAFMMAQLIYSKHMPNAEMSDSYWMGTLEYAESITQTHILAGLGQKELEEAYYHVKES